MFPQFTIHSTPLLIFVIQGLIFAVLLLMRYVRERKAADLLMALILLAMAYDRTTYTIGFMAWYDTFKNTKINYYLISLGLGMGPLIYLYVRSVTRAPFKLWRRDVWHFIPVGVYVLYRLILLAHDSQQAGWDQGYSGEWMSRYDDFYVSPVMEYIKYFSLVTYLYFSIKLFRKYRAQIRQFFSNMYNVELTWLRNFLFIYTLLFIYGGITDLVDLLIMDLHYVHVWWVHLFSAIVIVYLGINAYFTDLNGLYDLTVDIDETDQDEQSSTTQRLDNKQQLITDFIESEDAHLNPELTLKDLAQGVNMSIHDVSEVINNAMGVNFNELINTYRVTEVQQRLLDPANSHLSLIAIGLDSGFNSKATFNRVFKQKTGMSPSQYKASKQPA